MSSKFRQTQKLVVLSVALLLSACSQNDGGAGDSPGVLTSSDGLTISCTNDNLPLGTSSLCKVLYTPPTSSSQALANKTYDVTADATIEGSHNESISYDTTLNGYWVSNSLGESNFDLQATYQKFTLKKSITMLANQHGSFHALMFSTADAINVPISIQFFFELADGTLIPIVKHFTCTPLDSEITCDARHRTVTLLNYGAHSVKISWYNFELTLSLSATAPTTTTTLAITTTTLPAVTTTTIPATTSTTTSSTTTTLVTTTTLAPTTTTTLPAVTTTTLPNSSSTSTTTTTTTSTTTSTTTTSTMAPTTTTTLPYVGDEDEENDTDDESEVHTVKVCGAAIFPVHHRSRGQSGRVKVRFYKSCPATESRTVSSCLVTDFQNRTINRFVGNACEVRLNSRGLFFMYVLFTNGERQTVLMTP